MLQGADGPAKAETRAMIAWVRDEILKLLHPFMPFVTEELWRVTAESGLRARGLLALAPWPKHEALDDDEAEAEIGWVIDLVTAIRSVRAEMNITAAEIPLVLVGAQPATQARAGRWTEIIRRLARLSEHLDRGERAAGRGAAHRARRGRGAAAQGRDRCRRREGAAREGDGAGRRPTSPASTPSSPMPTSSGVRRRRWSKASARSARRPRTRRAKIIEALERLKGARNRSVLPATGETNEEQRPAGSTPCDEFWAAVGLLWLAGVGLRLTILAVPPVIALMQADLHLSGTEIGILSGLPVILFGIAALPGSLLIARFGALPTLVVGSADRAAWLPACAVRCSMSSRSMPPPS